MRLRAGVLPIVLAMVVFVAAPTMADMVNFYAAPYGNVDPPTGFPAGGGSTGNHEIDILDGGATLSAWGQNGGVLAYFSQKDSQGLGIWGDTEDDLISGQEKIIMIFNRAYYIDSVEFRSLFASTKALIEIHTRWGIWHPEDPLAPHQEHTHSWIVTATTYTDSVVTNLHLVEPSAGLVMSDYLLNPGDAITFSNLDTSDGKFFALAALELRPVPVPGAVLLGMLGLGYAGMRLRRHA